jgi:hypothetical protein
MKFHRLIMLLLTLVMACLFALPASALDWHTANQKTVGWDAYDNSAGNPGDAIAYNVYLRHAITGTQTLLEETTELSMLITFITEGMFLAGVSTVRKVDIDLDGVYGPSDVDENGNPIIMESEITWSDSADIEAVPVPFGLRYFVTPGATKGFGVR